MAEQNLETTLLFALILVPIRPELLDKFRLVWSIRRGSPSS
jgi:hypothetical protein